MLNPEIVKAVGVTAEITGASLTGPAMELIAEHLSGYASDVVLKALRRCQLELRSPLTLGAVMDRLDDGHPGPEIAWAMVAKLSEDESVVWTDQMARAFSVVRLMLSDRVASRLAFLEAYRIELADAREHHVPPTWWPSLGYDPAGRLAALTEAIEHGRLTPAQGARMLPEWQAMEFGAALTDGKASAKALVDDLARRLARQRHDEGPARHGEPRS